MVGFTAAVAAIGIGAQVVGQVQAGNAARAESEIAAANASAQAEADADLARRRSEADAALTLLTTGQEADNYAFQARQQRIQSRQQRAISYVEMARAKIRNDALLSTQKAGMSSSGFASDDATNQQIARDTIRMATIDELMIKALAEDEARQMDVQADVLDRSASNVRQTGQVQADNAIRTGLITSNNALESGARQANALTVSGRNAQQAGYIEAGSSLLKGVADWRQTYGKPKPKEA